jgi:hypothetical protein
MYRFVIIGMLLFSACRKSGSETPVYLKAIPQATATNLYVMLDATKSTGAISSWNWRQVDNPDSLIWWLGRNFSGKPNTAVSVVVPRKGHYLFGLMVYDTTGNWDYATINVEVK